MGMSLRDIIPWSLVWGAQNERHVLDNLLFGLRPGDADWDEACHVAKILGPEPRYLNLHHKPSASLLSGLKRSGLTVVEIVSDRAKYEAWIQKYVSEEIHRPAWRQAYKQAMYRVFNYNDKDVTTCAFHESVAVL